IVQVVLNPEHDPAPQDVVHALRSEYCIAVEGTVQARPSGTTNADLPTGDVDVVATSLTILNPSDPLPFQINDRVEVEEVKRLEFRYLDLRRTRMANNLRARSRAVQAMRRVLCEKDFLEVETPTLIASTPEGARDMLVPSRMRPGHFYALPQSPQLFKQMLMVAGVERYYQIARCYRDEDLRADRQLEFTQLDLEGSFWTQEDVLDTLEDIVCEVVGDVRGTELPRPFVRMTYAEAMRRFGTDKPDLRYGMELFDINDVAASSEFGVFRNAVTSGGSVEGICVPGGAEFSRKQIDSLTTFVQGIGAKGLVSIALLGQPGSLDEEGIRSPVAKYLAVDLVETAAQRSDAKQGDLLLLVAGEGGKPKLEPGSSHRVRPALDGLRREVAARLELADPNVFHYAFITEFPLVEWDEEEERWDALHHLFVAPMEEDLHFLDTDPSRVRSRAYDMICNGMELGSGSVRIHKRDLQERVLRLLGISDEEAQERFGHILEAFEYGAPPHAGFAPGIDRIVAQLAGETDIREVIAFPKSKSGADPMTGAPSRVSDEQLSVLGITVVEQPE
ncbi:MAG: aspartate--tRNA ligase, partial [Chloroflexi bacterium]|nr:aspartate--tRNA ligase [Chloroflexota bacterium]